MTAGWWRTSSRIFGTRCVEGRRDRSGGDEGKTPAELS
jgi:hypothetical protein